MNILKRALWLLMIVLLVASAAAAQEEPDADADGTPDLFDSCADQAGPAENSGCPDGVVPDFDKDGIADIDDLCYDQPGDAALGGCTPETFPDFDADTVADPFDACFDQQGLANNSGCPEGIIPDIDRDGIPDAEDQCPFEYGEPDFNGCQPDADADTIPDFADACPNEAGTTANYGCPAGGAAPDADGDTVPDAFDACPNEAGSSDQSGCADSDSDGVADSYDTCPNELGSIDLLGCPAVTSTGLPASRTPLSAANASALAQVGRLTLATPMLALADNGRLVIHTVDRALFYDLNNPQLAPAAEAALGVAGSPLAITRDGRFLAVTQFPPDFAGPSFVQIADGATGAPLTTYTPIQRDIGASIGVGRFAFSPTAPLLAVIEDAGMGYNSGFNSLVSLYNAEQGARTGEIVLSNTTVHLAFSPDGTRLAFDTSNGTTLQIELWDVATQTPVQTFESTPIIQFLGTPLVFSPDGALLAYGKPDGTLSLRDLNASSDRFTTPVFDQAAGEIVTAVAYSPDGALIAAAGGMAFGSGGAPENHQVVLLDAATGAVLMRLEGVESFIGDLHFSPDGSLLIASSTISVRFYGVGQ